MNRIIFITVLSLIAGSSSFCKKTTPPGTNVTTSGGQNVTAERSNTPYSIEVFAEGLSVPWSIVFTDSARMLLTERTGSIRQIVNGTLLEKPLKVFEDVAAEGEAGLMGLAVDPEYVNNRYVYVSYAYESAVGMKVKVVRFKDTGEMLSEEKVILDDIPAESYHAGCRIKFGPDGKLYITTGDAGERELCQDKDNLYGKILRINSDGTVPGDNPFPGNPVWSYGHRNPQGIDWYPGTGIMYSTEHGPSGFDGPGGGDEVNVIVKGGNYGWPEVSHEESREGMVSPVLVYTPAVAPADCMFYRSGVIEQFRNNLFIACLRGNAVIRVVVDENDPGKVVSADKMSDIAYGRIREIAEGPDGSIYFSTSNRDGRGRPAEKDDRIFRIKAK
ncbi:MAG: PQQ-dependent sugar dehydrogenase [Ignavibacteria bacterium]|nr:PQQ-dependent sugar dehydrogenase [Ignavibacteria bacterium]